MWWDRHLAFFIILLFWCCLSAQKWVVGGNASAFYICHCFPEYFMKYWRITWNDEVPNLQGRSSQRSWWSATLPHVELFSSNYLFFLLCFVQVDYVDIVLKNLPLLIKGADLVYPPCTGLRWQCSVLMNQATVHLSLPLWCVWTKSPTDIQRKDRE